MRGTPPERLYTQILGVALFVLGITGLLVGETVAVFNFELPEDLIHLGFGLAGIYLGFFNPDLRFDRMYAQVTGAVFLLAGLVGMVDSTLFGTLRLGLTPLDHVAHLAIGVAGLAVGFFYNSERTAALGRAGRRA